MYGEGIDLDDCELTTTLQITDGKGEREVAITNGKLPADIGKDARLSLSLLSSKAIAQPRLSGQFGGKHSAAKASGKRRSEEHTSEIQSLMRISFAVFCLK